MQKTKSFGRPSEQCCIWYGEGGCYFNNNAWLYCGTSSNRCEPCGQPGEKCCPTGLSYSQCTDSPDPLNKCNNTDKICHSPNGECGQLGKQCCRGDSAHAWQPFCTGTRACDDYKICRTAKKTRTFAGTIAAQTNARFGPFTVAPGSPFRADLIPFAGNPDVYVRFGEPPTQTLYDCRPYLSGTSNETCYLPVPSGKTTAYVMVRARGTLAATYNLGLTFYTP